MPLLQMACSRAAPKPASKKETKPKAAAKPKAAPKPKVEEDDDDWFTDG